MIDCTVLCIYVRGFVFVFVFFFDINRIKLSFLYVWYFISFPRSVQVLYISWLVSVWTTYVRVFFFLCFFPLMMFVSNCVRCTYVGQVIWSYGRADWEFSYCCMRCFHETSIELIIGWRWVVLICVGVWASLAIHTVIIHCFFLFMEVLSTEFTFLWNKYENFIGKPARPYCSSRSIVMFRSVVILCNGWFVWSCTKPFLYLHMLHIVSHSFLIKADIHRFPVRRLFLKWR